MEKIDFLLEQGNVEIQSHPNVSAEKVYMHKNWRWSSELLKNLSWCNHSFLQFIAVSRFNFECSHVKKRFSNQTIQNFEPFDADFQYFYNCRNVTFGLLHHYRDKIAYFAFHHHTFPEERRRLAKKHLLPWLVDDLIHFVNQFI